LPNPNQFCWRAIASDNTEVYYPVPPKDYIPNSAKDSWLTQYHVPVSDTTVTTNTNSNPTK
jgi:hypothetical protein